MKRTKIHEKYQDIHEMVSDPELFRVVEYVEDLVNEIKVPRSLLLSFEENYPSLSLDKRSKKNHRITGYRSLMGVLVFLFAVILMGMSHNVFSVLDRVFLSDPETADIIIEEYGQSVSFTRSFGDFTVTIERLYADKDQIIIGYSVSGPKEREFSDFALFGGYYSSDNGYIAIMPILFDEEGGIYPSAPTSWGSGVHDGYGGYLLRYSTGGLDETVQKLNLRLEVNFLQVSEIIPETNELRTTVIHNPSFYEFTVAVTHDG